MEETSHVVFITAAYATTVIVIGALMAWIVLDHRAQRRKLAELETRGIRRRSTRSEPAIEQAKEKA
jgi:heme exporter protein D